MKALKTQPAHPRTSRRLPTLFAVVLVVAGVALSHGNLYGQDPAGPRSKRAQETQAPQTAKKFGFQVPIPEIKLKSIIGDKSSRKSRPKREPQGTSSHQRHPQREVAPAPADPHLPDVAQPKVPRLPFERAHPFKRQEPLERTTSEAPERPAPPMKVPLAAPPKAPEDLMEARAPRKEVLAAPTTASARPPLLQVQPLEETPQALRIEPGKLDAQSSSGSMIAVKKRRTMQRIVLVPSQPEFDARPPSGQSEQSPAIALGPELSHQNPPSETSTAPANPSQTPESNASSGDNTRIARTTPPLDILSPVTSDQETPQVHGSQRIRTTPPSLGSIPPTRMKPPQSSAGRTTGSTGIGRARRSRSPLAIASPEPASSERTERGPRQMPSVLTAPPKPDGPESLQQPHRETPALAIGPPQPDTAGKLESSQERIPSVAMAPPKRDKSEVPVESARPHPMSAAAQESGQQMERSPDESATGSEKTLMARAHPSPEAPVAEPRETAPSEAVLPSPLDSDARQSIEVRDYLRATAPVLEELSLLITTAPTLAIANYDPTDQGGQAVLKDVLLKLNSMKRALQILDSKTFAIIPPTKYSHFHTTVRQSIAQTYQACDSIIAFLNGGKEDQLAKIHEHLSKAKELMQKTRSRRG